MRDKESSGDISDYSSDNEAQLGEEFYDASDELEDYQQAETIAIQLRDEREVTIQDNPSRLL